MSRRFSPEDIQQAVRGIPQHIRDAAQKSTPEKMCEMLAVIGGPEVEQKLRKTIKQGDTGEDILIRYLALVPVGEAMSEGTLNRLMTVQAMALCVKSLVGHGFSSEQLKEKGEEISLIVSRRVQSEVAHTHKEVLTMRDGSMRAPNYISGVATRCAEESVIDIIPLMKGETDK